MADGGDEPRNAFAIVRQAKKGSSQRTHLRIQALQNADVHVHVQGHVCMGLGAKIAQRRK